METRFLSPRLPLHVIPTLTLLFLIPSAGICECEKYPVVWCWSPDNDLGVLGKYPSNLATSLPLKFLKDQALMGTVDSNWLAVMARSSPSLELETLVLTPAQQLSMEDGNSRSVLCVTTQWMVKLPGHRVIFSIKYLRK